MQATSVADPRPFRAVLAAAVVLLLVLLGVAGLKSWRDLEAVRARQQGLETEIEQTHEHIEVLEEKVRQLTDDPATLERLAREELWMARPDEVVIVLPEGDERAEGASSGAGPR